MKIFLLFLLVMSATAVGQSAPVTKAAPIVTNPADAGAQKAKEIIQQSIQALGGQAYLNIKEMKQEGRGYGFDRFGASRGVGVPFTRSYAYFDRERYDFFRDGDWVIIHTGNKGYETTYHGTREQDPEEIADYLRRKEFTLEKVLLQWASDPKTAFFYEGETIAETKRVHQIALMNAQNQGVTLYIDIKTLLPVKKTFTWRNTEMREMWEESDMYDSYRNVAGVQTPVLLTSTRNGKMFSQRFLKNVTYNNGFHASLFTPPPVNFGAKKK
jgi:hypothetical protein